MKVIIFQFFSFREKYAIQNTHIILYISVNEKKKVFKMLFNSIITVYIKKKNPYFRVKLSNKY